MNQHLKTIQDLLQQNKNLSEADKEALLRSVAAADKQWTITDFKLDRTEKVKKTTAILLEETIAELEQKRKAVEEQNRELEIESSLERVRAVAMGMNKPDDLLSIVETLFKELQKLGFSELRNSMINIHNDEKGSFLNYDYSDFAGAVIANVDYNVYHSIQKLVTQARSSKDAFIEYVYSGKELTDWKEVRKKNGEYDDPRVETIPALYYYFYSIGIGSIGISAFSAIDAERLELLKRFRNVFDLAYRRYIDITKAEAQAREAKIEAALERVRSRSMSMHKSEELGDISSELFRQVQLLGVTTWHCAFNIYDEGQDSSTEWGTNAGGTYPKYKTPREGIFLKYYEIGQTGESLHIEVIGEDRCSDHYAWLCTLPGVGEELLKLRAAGVSFPTSQIDHVAYFKYGYLLFISYEPAPEAYDIFKRFAKVFEQAYTRFLDLQKAEAQARESQIEAGLERVRARAMAMHKSDELLESASLLYRELSKLGIEKLTCGYVLMDEDEKLGWNYSVSFADGSIMPQPLGLCHTETNVMRARVESWRKKEPLLVIELDPQETLAHQAYIAENSVNYPTSKEHLLSFTPERLVIHTFNFKHGYLLIVGGILLTREQQDMVVRFAKVFEMTYTRFLDLKKAEAQARESQIELALERVRARTMAMQKSDELQDAAFLLFQQVQALGARYFGCGFNIWDDDKKEATAWMAREQGFQPPFKTSSSADVFFHIHEAAQRGESLFVAEQSGPGLETHYKYMASIPIFKGIMDKMADAGLSVPSFQIIHCAFFSHGYLMFISFEPVAGAHDIFKRFAKVFEQTYTRFLDLQKAEAQAKESQIQLALERVRARTMAMQHSDELKDAAALLFQQVKSLGVPAYSCGYNIWEEDDQEFTSWMSTQDGSDFNGVPNIPLTEDANFIRYVESKQKGEPFFVLELRDERMQEHYEYLKTIPAFKAYFDYAESVGFDLPETQIHHLANFSHGNLLFITLEPCAEFHDVFKRFSFVFEQTYTRFLDLKKAEAQAREAQVEAALERVRSKTMAMHKSEELPGAASLLFHQIQLLGMPAFAAGYCIWEKDKQAITLWMSSEGVLQPPFKAPTTEDELFIQMRKGYEDGRSLHVVEMGGEELVAHYHYMRTLPVVGDIFDSILEAGHPLPVFQVMHYAYFSKGFLLIITYESVPDAHAIFKRFAAVFDQTYTRFLDLQKSEAQAKESQIELGLERVRARAMAMQKSDELADAAQLLYHEFGNLGINTFSCGYMFIDEQKQTQTAWVVLPDGSLLPDFIVFPLTGDPVLDSRYRDWKEKKLLHIYELQGEANKEHHQFLSSHVPSFVVENIFSKIPDRIIFHCANFSNGYLLILATELFSLEEQQTIIRFAKVFEQTYTRFLDLQKAEAQAREATIEAALEKVRSRTMGMQKSEELKEIIRVVHEQILYLDIHIEHAGFIMDYKARDDMHIWLADRHDIPTEVTIPYFDSPHWNSFIEAKEKGLDFFANHHSFEEKNKFYLELFKLFPGVPEEAKDYYLKSPGLAISTVLLDNVGLYIENFKGVPFTTEENAVLMRFGKVFEQTYTRFLDLQKAEAQAKEAQVQLALERVRARTMAMHKSAELGEAAVLLYKELKSLGVTRFLNCGYVEIDEENNIQHGWMTKTDGARLEGYTIPLTGDEVLQLRYDAWKRKDTIFHQQVGGDKLKNHTEFTNPHLGSKEVEEMVRLQFPDPTIYYCGNFSHGYLHLITGTRLDAEDENLLTRFTRVFEMTYKRFLDLQKAESQAREAKIEAAMEKVRARAMAMQKPGELVEVAQLLRKEMGLLGVEELETSSIYIHDDDTGTTECWYAIQDIREQDKKLVTDHMTMQLNDTRVGQEMLKFYYSDQKQVSILMQGADRKEWIDYCAGHSSLFSRGYYGEVIPDRTYHLSRFSNGFMGAATPGDISAESWELLRRATTAFSLAYTRFNDLQHAEANAKEAIKQSALDRIRAEIASMRTVNDLEKITPLIWKELNILGISFIRCGVFIMDDPQQLIHTFLSAPDGKAIAAFHLPYDTPGHFPELIDHWHREEIYVSRWSEDDFIGIANTLVKQGAIATTKQYLGTLPKGGFYLHFLPFFQGMLYVGNTEQMNRDEISLVRHVADAFSTAYARYEDFNNLEAAKQQVDKTLVDLKQAQTQLVQSEKMASLGELTAGIAHEIQNPLNFVNNFSDVSNELLEEMKAELEKGNKEDAMALVNDVKQNLEKILHHGRRADAIVKGMLQHSRTSSGQKEPTDINLLCDEYLRLAFHGLRAKDKSFNARFETNFDGNIGNINIIPQDIGRVLVNLINNAFYAVSQKQKTNGKNYEPAVFVRTKKFANYIEVRIKDNGPGISQKVMDKIFQPFFTTKPTGQGTGLGLSLSYDIVTKGHNGELRVETNEGEGSEFIIQLPVANT